MTKSEHEKERRAFWDALVVTFARDGQRLYLSTGCADIQLKERDKRFPAPTESEEK
jgi:hypothetical protein